MVEQVPTNEQDREENERNKYEFKSWKGNIRYPAPPQALWNNTQKDLADLYERSNVPQMPDFEHKYLAALFAAMEKPISEQVGRAQFFVSDQQAIWLLKLKQENPPIVSAVWRFGYQSWDRDRQPWNILKERVIRPSLADEGSVGFYCRASNDMGDWSTVHCIRRVIDSGKWSTPAIVGGVAETTSQHHTMTSDSGDQAQAACRRKGLVRMKRDKKWLIRSDLAQVTSIAIPVIREPSLADVDARNSRIIQQSIGGK